MKTTLVSLLLSFFALNSFSQETWKGFKKENFSIDGHQGRIVIPEKAAYGNPWIWRARFPNWHTEQDSILVAEGFHLVYVNTDNLFGHESAMKIWDQTYYYLTQNYALAPKVALSGVSRGGLFVYNWASRNPDKVASVYAEAPVCDFTSWPGGFGEGMGSKKDWQKLKEVYGFKSDEEAKAFQNIPLNQLEPIAKAKIPLLTMIGLEDEVVPYAENTKILANRYIDLGGKITVVPCTIGEQKLHGHHFDLETPRYIADFVKYHNNHHLLNSSKFHKHRNGISSAIEKFEKGGEARIAFLGGSITYGGGWRDSLMTYFEQTYPQTTFDFVQAGIPSMGSTPDAFRLERDVLSKGSIDLLFVEAAVNDDTNRRTKDEILNAMEGIVRNTMRNNPAADIISMHFVDPGKIESYRKGEVPEVIALHESIADHYDIPSLNLAKEVQERIDNYEFTWEDDFKNLHPSPFGHGIYAASMIHFLEYERVLSAEYSKEIAFPQSLRSNPYDNGKLAEAISLKNVKRWQKVKSWTPSDGKGTRANYVNTPFLVSEKPGSSLKFTFTGNAVGIAVAAGPDAGRIAYRIDKGDWQEQTLFTRWSERLHLPWYFTLASDLSNTKHTLELKTILSQNEKSTGNACRIRYVYYNESK